MDKVVILSPDDKSSRSIYVGSEVCQEIWVEVMGMDDVNLVGPEGSRQLDKRPWIVATATRPKNEIGNARCFVFWR